MTWISKNASAFTQILAGLVLIVVVTLFGYTGHLTPAQTYDGIMALTGIVGGLGLWLLASTKPNIAALPHLFLGLVLVVAVLILGLHSVFSNTQISAYILVILGPSIIAGTTVVTAPTPSAAPPASQIPQGFAPPPGVVGDLGSPQNPGVAA